MGRTTTIAYGDYQTPPRLASDVCALLGKHGLRPASLLEPTCGLGSFLFAGLDRFKGIQKAVGADINREYIQRVGAALRQRPDADRVRLFEADFFSTDWQQVIAELPEPMLVLGNLPWVTSARLTTLGSQNLPAKSNFKNHRGIDAVTGKANFDISEWMLIHLLQAMNGRRGALAVLCKSSVARKALYYGWKSRIALERAAVYRIDAGLHFDAAVDAALLLMHLGPGAYDQRAKLYSRLTAAEAEAEIGYEDGTLLSDVAGYRRWRHLCGKETVKWRSGVKHDCSKVMEFRREGERYRNGLGELVELEDAYLFPLLKSSHLARGRVGDENRYMLVTQRTIGEDTAGIRDAGPRTWAYLTAHAALLNKRGSSIYRHRPQFSIFGVGDYSFAPWKVAVSGFYKSFSFVAIGPLHGKPVMLDDTSYFLACQTNAQAEYLTSLLNSPAAQAFYRAFVFWDAKRPITVDLLRRLSLRGLAKENGLEAEFDMHMGGTEGPLFA